MPGASTNYRGTSYAGKRPSPAKRAFRRTDTRIEQNRQVSARGDLLAVATALGLPSREAFLRREPGNSWA